VQVDDPFRFWCVVGWSRQQGLGRVDGIARERLGRQCAQGDGAEAELADLAEEMAAGLLLQLIEV